MISRYPLEQYLDENIQQKKYLDEKPFIIECLYWISADNIKERNNWF